MKNLIQSLLTILLFSPQALAGVVGSYSFAHEVGFGGGYTRASCQNENGQWKRGACYFVGSDSVGIAKSLEGKISVQVNTIRSNGRECEFVGPAIAISATELLATTDSELWLPGESEDEFFKVVPAVCELKLTFLDPNTVRVEKLEAAKCASVCGTSMLGLDISGARRDGIR